MASERDSDREDLVGEHPLGDMGQIVLLLVFLVVWAADAFFFHYSTFSTIHFPVYMRGLAGLTVLCVSGWLARNGLKIVFGEKRERPCVIRKGVFGLVRHPIYLSAILLYLGLLILSLSLIAAIIWLVTIAFYYYISRHEEKLLVAKFGQDYAVYMREVPMLIPRLLRPRDQQPPQM